MRFIIRSAATTAAAALTLMAFASAAQAHVNVSSPNAVQGGYALVTFRVPTESATASTTGLKVQLPTDTPLASVSVQPQPGWTYTTTKSKLATPISTDDGQLTEAVTEINWTATGDGAIKPGEFNQFNISVGPLPKTSSITFKAIQHYSDNTDVSWVEVAAPGSSAEPEHPAPVLKLAASTTAAATTTPTTGVTVTSADQSDKGASTTSVTIAIVLGAVGIALGAGGLLLGWSRRRSPANRAQ